jgi:hypothetical protein
MNTSDDNSLDDRLRQSDPAGHGGTPTAIDPAGRRGSGVKPLRAWWLTTSRRARQSLIGGTGIAAAATVVIAGTFGASTGPLIQLADGSNSAAMASRSGGVAEDKMMMPYLTYDYVAGDTLSTSGGRGLVYRLNLDGTPEEVLRRAATYFGVSGEPQKSQYFDDAWPSYVVGPEDGTAPSVTVGWSGTGTWWYSNPLAYPEQECIAEYRVGKGENAYTECREYEPLPSGMNPDENETRNLASEFFTTMGVAFDPAEVTVLVDEWSSFASVPLTVAGQRTAVEWSISWSGNGEISWAQGNSISVASAGTFDTVSEVAAVDRLADWRWFGAGPTNYQGGVMMMRSSADSSMATDGDTITEEPVAPTEPTEGSGEPTETPAPTETEEPTPNETVEPEPLPTIDPTNEPSEPELEVRTITIDEAESVLLLVWDASGTAWLVPGVALTGVDSWWQTVITLVEGVIQLPEPMDSVEPMPID